MVLDVLPYTITLTFSAIGLAVLIGVPLGCYAATHPNSLGDRIGAVLSVSFIAMPSFVVAIYLLLIFSIWLHWLPVLGTGSGGLSAISWRGSVLPAVSLALGWIGYIARLVRSSLLEVLGEAYIRTSRAYGISERQDRLQIRAEERRDPDRGGARARHRAAARRRDLRRDHLRPARHRHADLHRDQRSATIRSCRPACWSWCSSSC